MRPARLCLVGLLTLPLLMLACQRPASRHQPYDDALRAVLQGERSARDVLGWPADSDVVASPRQAGEPVQVSVTLSVFEPIFKGRPLESDLLRALRANPPVWSSPHLSLFVESGYVRDYGSGQFSAFVGHPIALPIQGPEGIERFEFVLAITDDGRVELEGFQYELRTADDLDVFSAERLRTSAAGIAVVEFKTGGLLDGRFLFLSAQRLD
ncbi:MAG: hypothetical protein KF858_03670 [Candidatus Sumerlaeia bacterium]|nr:hypothetical protein [Candidatus Sumerlaeia bacterium]